MSYLVANPEDRFSRDEAQVREWYGRLWPGSENGRTESKDN